MSTASFIWFLMAASGTLALKCYFCTDCRQELPAAPAECRTPAHDACLKGEQGDLVEKSCLPKQFCPGGDKFHRNKYSNMSGATIHCCDTDGCNGAGLPAPAALLLLTVPLIASVLLSRNFGREISTQSIISPQFR
ncbi:uncharacterized protein LOC108666392 [Hyalella azteca]|uniref:Uncharacterized protein LOC108666392 n=1 Tax=Hyalella azteca TaxID=294128 RepID=A0A8B7N624_HYAAZ|nr:uncharacterized protein LOC108666392 [Hyalella azteca]